MNAPPVNLTIGDSKNELLLTLTCSHCRDKGEPSQVEFDQHFRQTAWTENEKLVVVPAVCNTCGYKHIFTLRLP